MRCVMRIQFKVMEFEGTAFVVRCGGVVHNIGEWWAWGGEQIWRARRYNGRKTKAVRGCS